MEVGNFGQCGGMDLSPLLLLFHIIMRERQNEIRKAENPNPFEKVVTKINK